MNNYRKWRSIDNFRTWYTDLRRYKEYVNTMVNTEFTLLPKVKLHGCISEDTLITLADGSIKKIKDLKKNTSILSYNIESQTIEVDVVEKVHINDLDKRWVRLHFDNGSYLECTEDHPILTKRGWINASNLLDSDELICAM